MIWNAGRDTALFVENAEHGFGAAWIQDLSLRGFRKSLASSIMP